MSLPSLHGCHVLNSTRIAHQMLSNPTLNLIAKMPVRPADQMPNVLFCLALTRFHDRIENSAETTTAALRRLKRCRCDGWRKFAYVNEPFQHFRLPLFTAAGRRDKPPAQVGRIHLFSRVGDVGSLSPERIGDGRERAGRKKGEIDLQSVPRFENRRENAGKKSERLCPAVDFWLRCA